MVNSTSEKISPVERLNQQIAEYLVKESERNGKFPANFSITTPNDFRFYGVNEELQKALEEGKCAYLKTLDQGKPEGERDESYYIANNENVNFKITAKYNASGKIEAKIERR